jgi:hypothetical protein
MDNKEEDDIESLLLRIISGVCWDISRSFGAVVVVQEAQSSVCLGNTCNAGLVVRGGGGVAAASASALE